MNALIRPDTACSSSRGATSGCLRLIVRSFTERGSTLPVMPMSGRGPACPRPASR